MKLIGRSSLLILILMLGAVQFPGETSLASDELDIWIGQMLLIGFRGTELTGNEPVLQDIREIGIGGVVLFNYDVPAHSPVRNITSPAQVRQLVRTLQGASTIPLFVAIDQEGGRVTRLKPESGFPPTVSQAELGRQDNEDITRRHAGSVAHSLRDIGINLNFAPVVDLAVNPENPVIAKLERSYGAEPDRVTRHARWAIEEFHKAGVLSAIKHFPGHGSSLDDSHLGLPDVTRQWRASELEPFSALTREGLADMVMTAHIHNSVWDNHHPATLSRAVIGGILRKQLGFEGVVVSDDLQMKAITSTYGFDEAVELAVDAGVDILVIANNQVYEPGAPKRVAQTLKSLVRQGKLSRGRIQRSYRRIMKLKERLEGEFEESN
jgi:beta-N-acetylhexosaminidase